MRYFLIFFCFFFQICLAQAQTNDHSLQKIIEGFTKISLVEQGIFTGRKGLGEYQETEFGRFRLISCSGGIQKDNTLFLMIEGQLNEGWVLNKPMIPPSENEEILTEEILYPVADLNEKRFKGYKTDVYFSLAYLLKEKTKEFNLNKKFLVTACKGEECKEALLDLSLLMKDDSKYPTDICAKMLRRYKLVVQKPKKEKIDAFLSIIDENHLQLVATFNQDVSFLTLQTDALSDFEIVQKEFKDHQASLLIKTDTQNLQESFLATLISSAGIFEFELHPQKNSYYFFSEKTNWFGVIISGILLFFLSPLFYLFLSLPNQEAPLLRQVRKIEISFGLLFLILAVIFYLYPAFIDLFEVYGVRLYLCLAILIWLIFKPKFILPLGILFFFLLPKPYLIESISTVCSQNGWGIFILFLTWYIISILPFEIFKKHPQLFGALQNLKQYPVLIRLPQLILSVWFLFSFIGGMSEKDQSETLYDLKQSHQTMYLSVEKGLCLRCVLNKLTFSYYLKYLTDYDRNKVSILTVDAKDEKIKGFLAENKLPNKTQGLLFGPKQAYPERIKEWVPIEEWYPLFQKVVSEEKQELPVLYYEE